MKPLTEHFLVRDETGAIVALAPCGGATVNFAVQARAEPPPELDMHNLRREETLPLDPRCIMRSTQYGLRMKHLAAFLLGAPADESFVDDMCAKACIRFTSRRPATREALLGALDIVRLELRPEAIHAARQAAALAGTIQMGGWLLFMHNQAEAHRMFRTNRLAFELMCHELSGRPERDGATQETKGYEQLGALLCAQFGTEQFGACASTARHAIPEPLRPTQLPVLDACATSMPFILANLVPTRTSMDMRDFTPERVQTLSRRDLGEIPRNWGFAGPLPKSARTPLMRMAIFATGKDGGWVSRANPADDTWDVKRAHLLFLRMTKTLASCIRDMLVESDMCGTPFPEWLLPHIKHLGRLAGSTPERLFAHMTSFTSARFLADAVYATFQAGQTAGTGIIRNHIQVQRLAELAHLVMSGGKTGAIRQIVHIPAPLVDWRPDDINLRAPALIMRATRLLPPKLLGDAPEGFASRLFLSTLHGIMSWEQRNRYPVPHPHCGQEETASHARCRGVLELAVARACAYVFRQGAGQWGHVGMSHSQAEHLGEFLACLHFRDLSTAVGTDAGRRTLGLAGMRMDAQEVSLMAAIEAAHGWTETLSKLELLADVPWPSAPDGGDLAHHAGYEFRWLDGQAALLRQGHLMHNCVASYAGAVLNGYSGIWSVEGHDWRGTLELSMRNGKTLRVAQLLGPCNTPAPAEAMLAATDFCNALK